MKASPHQSVPKPKKTLATSKESELFHKRPSGVDEPGRRKLGPYEGMPGYFMSDDFCITTKEEFDV